MPGSYGELNYPISSELTGILLSLPRRVRPVAVLLATGMPSRDIADTLTLQKHTVENYVGVILLGLNCPNRATFASRYGASNARETGSS